MVYNGAVSVLVDSDGRDVKPSDAPKGASLALATANAPLNIFSFFVLVC